MRNDIHYFQAKLAARRARRLAESQRKMEEEEAQRVVAEQRKQMQQQGGTGSSGGGSETIQSQDTGLLVAPKMSYGESTEEQALKKEQVTKLWLKIYRRKTSLKILKVGTPKIIAIIVLNMEQFGFTLQSELEIRGSIENNSKIIFLISQRKHML